ncbi:virulence-associated V antigen [Photobacterium damselae]|uniref:Type III secretion LcrG inhibitor (LcrV,secretion and targeting control protein V antigen) n=2 Tax=Photobacterium damselae TaxID=38293 RepID=D0Z4V9_PHODD|nr:virulence-associated V antigen [Photobacterium damselae]EEZ39176.1 type III secretion LcrG inhibitor (LcrV,secretion and targeting control protein V antigen) [Photobacterium damselae subsp. damselae CIP 102761]PSW81944.1 Type III secretion cytoplasmic LcrG inhibitor [Photobacterium damselae]SPY45110.1 Low calcium response locus protein V [Photobacterium damselae]
MTDMTTMNSVSGVLNTATNRDYQASFQQRLVETLSPILGDSDAAQLESLIRQLPMVVGRTEQDSLDLYADSLRTLLEKQAAFTGTAAAETAAHWMQLLQHQAVNGQIAPQDVMTGVNNTLAHQFQSWFDKQLKDTVDSSLPTDFINEFRLGSQSTQAQQIAALDASALTAATAEVSKFVDALAQQMSSSEVRDSAISFLRNAFRNLVSVDVNGLKNSDYLLTQESFSAAVTAQLVASLDSVDIKLSKSDADVLAGKIAWIPGMSKQELNDALNDLAKQVKGQFANSYTAGGKDELQAALDTVVNELNNSPNEITLSSLLSSIAVSLVNTQVDAFYGGLEDVQVTQATPDQVALIKQSTARDITLLFEKIVARQDSGTDFTSRHKKMLENLDALKIRLSKITKEEKDNKAVNAEHALTARDLLSVIESSIGDRFDERVLFALNERRVNRLEKRNEQKQVLEELTIRLKFFGVVQSRIHSFQSRDASYDPFGVEGRFKASDFNYSNDNEFKASPEYKYLSKNKIEKHGDFLRKEGLTVPYDVSYQDTKDNKKLSNFSSSVSDKSKLLNDEVQIKTTELNDTSSQYNSTVEAMNKFVQKYHSILQEILRAI